MAPPLIEFEPHDDDTLHALLSAFTIIIFSEIGDKTFLIAAILAMRRPRLTVFAGAFGSLMVMSLLSAQLGHLLPTLLPRRVTELAAAVLFFVFGMKMLKEANEMSSGNQKIQEEMKEAEEEIEGDDAKHDGTGHHIPLEEMEEGGRLNGHVPHTSRSRSPGNGGKNYTEGIRNFFSFFLGPVFVQAFVLTFLGEWGDRSQISTIALGAAHNAYLVTIGTIVGHGLCTALAVLGGRYVSSKISVKHMTFAGSMLFLLFGFIYVYGFFYGDSAIVY